MADIFISYAKVDRGPTERLAEDLTRRGYTVWWDTSLLGGDEFRPVIVREIAAAQAVIVIWTPASVQSVWVLAEAELGRAQGKLLPVRVQTLNPGAIPMPFGVFHTELLDNRDRIAASLARLNDPQAQHQTLASLAPGMRASTRAADADLWPDGSQKGVGIGARSLPGAEFRDLPHTPLMVVIPAGGFLMGSALGEVGRAANEGPQHRVRIGAPLAVGKYPVTFAEWDAFCDATQSAYRPSDNGWGRERRPVVNVSYDDALAYCTWLSNATGRAYRLLTESEWEYSCRAGTTMRYAFGDAITTEQANFNSSAYPQPNSANAYRARTTPVGQFAENVFGLADMHGNVSEWVEDPWDDNFVQAPADGSSWNGIGTRRVVRGGSWFDQPQHVRSARRSWMTPAERAKNVGVRVCRAL